MRDVGREPAERREFHLPRLRLQPRQILEKNHCADITAVAHRNETRAHLIVQQNRNHRVEAGNRIPAPLFEPPLQQGRVLLQTQLLAQWSEHLFGTGVVLPD